MPLAGRIAVWLATTGLLVSVPGCSLEQNGTRTPLGTNDGWKLIAIGDLNPPTWPFGSNQIKFELERDGRIYGTGPLLNIGPNDDGLLREYRHYGWVAESIFRFWDPPRAELGSLSVVILNEAASLVKWIRMRSGDLWLLFDLLSGEQTELSIPYWGGDYAPLSILLEMEDGRRHAEVSATVRKPTSRLLVRVLDEAIALVPQAAGK